jgi:hypothetical protein
MAYQPFFCHPLFQDYVYIDFHNNPVQNGQDTQIRKMKAAVIINQLFFLRKH